MKEKIQYDYEMSNQMIKKGYSETKCIIPKKQVFILGFLIPLPVVVIVSVIFKNFLLERAHLEELGSIDLTFGLLIILGISTLLHESIHGVIWASACNAKWKSIEILWNVFMPTCHCKEVLNQKKYLFGVLAPFIILGGASLVILLIYPSTYTLLTVLVNIMLAGGDLLLCFKLLKHKNGKIFDLPNEVGFLIYSK